jgi:hypothetical protein
MTHENERRTIPLKTVSLTMEERTRLFFSEANSQSARRENFLVGWKCGIQLAGETYFKITAESVDAAHDKWQLQPDYEMIQDAIGRISAGQGAFLAAMYSFYNPDDGQKLLTAAGYPNLADLASKLDPEQSEVIAALFLNYGGW